MLLPFHKGVTEALLFAGMALVGRGDAARTLFRDVELWLPDVGKRNTSGAWAVLKLSVPGLMLGDDLVRCGALYPSCISYVSTGVTNHWSITTAETRRPWRASRLTPQAYATGRTTTAKTAIRQADTLPHRLLQPTAHYWYGRLLVDDPHPPRNRHVAAR